MEIRNNIGCDIARDLMPLVIDGIASDAAKAAVEEHTARCAECGRIMEALREESELARQPAPPEAQDTRFIQFCRRMEKRFTLRRAILALLALLLVIAVIAGGFTYVNYQTNNASAYMKLALHGKLWDAHLLSRNHAARQEPRSPSLPCFSRRSRAKR